MGRLLNVAIFQLNAQLVWRSTRNLQLTLCTLLLLLKICKSLNDAHATAYWKQPVIILYFTYFYCSFVVNDITVMLVGKPLKSLSSCIRLAYDISVASKKKPLPIHLWIQNTNIMQKACNTVFIHTTVNNWSFVC